MSAADVRDVRKQAADQWLIEWAVNNSGDEEEQHYSHLFHGTACPPECEYREEGRRP